MCGRSKEDKPTERAFQVLNLARNKLFGLFPSSIANITILSVINLGTNSLDGKMHSNLSRLRNLKFLDLRINNFSGTVPASIYNVLTLPNLLGFNFSFNRFTGTVPGSLHSLTRIRMIRLAHNLSHGSIPPGLENLPELEMFLKKFYMGGNPIFGGITRSIGQLRCLELLDMSYAEISGEIPPEIGQFQLRGLGLAGNPLYVKIPNSLGNLQKLNKIDLSKNELLNGSIPPKILHLPSLSTFLNLSNNYLTGSLPEEVGFLMLRDWKLLIFPQTNSVTQFPLIFKTCGHFRSSVAHSKIWKEKSLLVECLHILRRFIWKATKTSA
ncbi:unnamed protein product [Coffea canephora]|uniref:Leucine-rich repeat-containing N-terminal plant-type domain-containing protein n=1 Tax=Coffea canephora TaxID=49390 RepID=A0A068TY82_COFCA|nr:unnamed protein product [Coffea canephora]